MNSVTVEHISKQYRIESHEPRSILQVLLSLNHSTQQVKQLPVLCDVSFTVASREIVGIVGRNGCGKSTLLRIIAGILMSDTGTVVAKGRLVPLIHLDSGVKARLTMKENIYLAGTLLGMSTTRITSQLDSIVKYAGLEQFLHTKWYTFSDGMKQKIVFSIGVHARPDILLLDEAFSAGDRTFRLKSMETIKNLSQSGVTVLMVGHDLGSMKDTCTRIIWIDQGVIKKDGPAVQVIESYIENS